MTTQGIPEDLRPERRGRAAGVFSITGRDPVVKNLRTIGVIGLLALSLWSAPVSAQYSYQQAAYDACAQYGCDGAQLYRVLLCESGGDPNAIGPNGELGVMQVDPRYWPAAYYGPIEQIHWAAMMFSQGYSYLWVCQ